jgi:uncharacterized repeat protein (TIGR01451 family)
MLLAALPAFAAPGTRMRAVVSSIQADIAVHGDAAETTTPGADLSFFIVVSCAGPDTSGPVTFSWTTPPGTSYLGMDLIALDPPTRPAPTDCTTPPVGSAGTVTCTASSVAPPGTGQFGGGTISIQNIHMRVLASSGFVTNTVTATSANDPNPANNSMSASTAIIGSGSTDMALALTGPDGIGPDGAASYGITVRNNGPVTASNVRLEFAAPAGATIDSFNAGSLACYQMTVPSTLVECNTATAPPGWSTSLTVNTHVPAPAGGTVTAGAHVTADGGDTVPSNNHASWSMVVTSAGNIDLRFSSPTVETISSQPFTFTAHLGNTGGSPLGAIVVDDTIPAGLTLVSVTPSSGTCNVTGQIVECRMDDLAPGAAATIAFVATSATAGTIPNRIGANTATQSASATVSINVLASSRHRAAGH